MTQIKSVHHINFLVREINPAVEQLSRILNLEPIFESLPGRGAKTARFSLGSVWLVVVQPLNQVSPLMKLLDERGEGLFLLSLGVDSIEESVAKLQESGISMSDKGSRKGLDNWQVWDIAADIGLGPVLQICQETE